MTDNYRDGVYCCSGIKWDWYGGEYGAGLVLRGSSYGVTASFDCASLGVLMRHCAQDHVNPKIPQNLVGLLFEVRFDGNLCRAIRIHPAYGKEKPWLRAGIVTMNHSCQEQIRKQLEVALPRLPESAPE